MSIRDREVGEVDGLETKRTKGWDLLCLEKKRE